MKCISCGKTIDEKYKYCSDCNMKNTISSSIKEIPEILQGINQNLGAILEIKKRQHAQIWLEIQRDWEKKKEAKDNKEKNLN
jgi:hypothetical protein